MKFRRGDNIKYKIWLKALLCLHETRDKITSARAASPYLDAWTQLITAKPTRAFSRRTNEPAVKFHSMKL